MGCKKLAYAENFSSLKVVHSNFSGKENTGVGLEYFAFGETFVEEHSNTDRTPYLFNGKEQDEETGLYYYGARYYDARTSIWMTVDPLADKFPGWSPYNYTMNNPINLIDPTGKEAEDTPATKNFVVIDGRNLPNDKALQNNIEAVKKLDPSVVVIAAKNKKDMMNQIQEHLSENEKIGNLIIAGHGGYNNSGTYVGSDYISSEKQFKALGQELSAYTSDNSNIVLTACHSGEGASSEKSEKKLQALSNSSGANVFGNMSWGNASVNRFSNSGSWLESMTGTRSFAAFSSLPEGHKGCLKGQCAAPNAASNLGNWKVVKPNSNSVNIVKNLYFTMHGNIKYD